MAELTRVRVVIQTHYNGLYGRSLGERRTGDIIEIPSGAYTDYLVQNGFVRLIETDDPPVIPPYNLVRLEEDIRDDEVRLDIEEDWDEDESLVLPDETPDEPEIEEKPRRGGRRKKGDD